ncbi:MFS transporter [Hoyosella rhizosphaerae]|uniref:MFS transporter n=1 Tax=Hoyosella rhizosphaerae TaxID=1755582 RepID=A0A916U0D3_9ACTN|nr:MFS transporter [Hoyosella rhizosphaerae]MBN4926943.1 MFS transporter [Hoyosella rhizosphaerae]GGC55304.1 MFS transporter [Hoyosella rhizosphaerae]
MDRYAQMWRIPGAPTLLLGGIVARLGQGVTVIAWLLLVRETRGSYADAAAVTAAISLATAAAAPVVGRLADLYSAQRVLSACAVVYSLSRIALLTAVLNGRPLIELCVLALITGASFPPVSPALRATWSMLTAQDKPHADLRQTTMAAESALFEFVFVVGPLLLSATILITGFFAPGDPAIGPAAAILGAAACSLLGCLWLARGTGMRSMTPIGENPRTTGLGPLRAHCFPALLGAAAGVMFAFGAAPVAIAAFAEEIHAGGGPGVTGVLIAIWSLGSAIGGIWFGTIRLSAPLRTQFLVILAILAAGYFLWAASPNTFVLAAILFISGAIIAPALAVMANIVAELTVESMRNEAYTWLTTISMSFAAVGAAVTGLVVESAGGARAGFIVAGLATFVALIVALRVRTPERVPA